MLRRTNIAPGPLATLAVAVAIVMLMVPTCTMIGCSMSGGRMFIPFGEDLGMAQPCGGTYVVSRAPLAAGPLQSETTVTLAFVALIVAFVLFAPRVEATPVRSARDGPPPSSDVSDRTPLRI